MQTEHGPRLSASLAIRGLIARAQRVQESYVKNYEGANIRNVALVGHSHSGKTSLTSALLFTAGATQRLGRVDEGNTVTDYDEEEISRAMSISAATAVIEWGKTKINLVDAPGFNMFMHEAEMALPSVEAALVVVDAVSGVEVVTERIWNYAEKLALPRVIVCTRMDRERADYRPRHGVADLGIRSHRRSRAVAHRQREELHRRDRPGEDAGLHLRDGRQRQSQSRRHSRQPGRAGEGRARAPHRSGRRRR